MKSSRIVLDKRRRTYVRMIGEIRHALNEALTEENARRGLTQADIARILDRDPSFVSRKLNGTGNMTLETLADLAYALDRPIKVSLPARTAAAGHAVVHSAYLEDSDGKVVQLHPRGAKTAGASSGGQDAPPRPDLRKKFRAVGW